jgi:PfaD family protein
MSPPPPQLLDKLVREGRISAAEAALARHVPIAEDVTVESDSGGHTDNRPLSALLPSILALRDELTSKYAYTRPIRVGAAGGLGTPASVAGAFASGADYVLTGSVNQSAAEAGVSPEAKEMLSRADLTDVAMAPAPDMFEAGIKVQVLKRGTLYASRAAKLYELYRRHDAIEDIPTDVVQQLERDVFQMPLDEVWEQTRSFFEEHARPEIDRARRDPKHKMALVFRWYLGLSSRWAIEGDPRRRLDYQIWCGPAMGAFNAWTADSPLADPGKRTVAQIARNLLEGAAHITRAQQLRCSGVSVPPAAFCFRPRILD